MCPRLRFIKRYICNLFYTQTDHTEYMPLLNIDLSEEYIPIPSSPLSPEGGSDDNIAYYD